MGVSAAFFLLSFVFVYRGNLKRKLARTIENTPTSRIRGIHNGLVEIKGTVESIDGMTLSSNFTGNPCVYHTWKIMVKRGSGKNSYWSTVAKNTASVLFYIKDDSGVILVDPAKATLDIDDDVKEYSCIGDDPSLEIQSFLEREGIKWKGLFGYNRNMRFKEKFLAPGDHCYILGATSQHTYRNETWLREDAEPLMIAKGPKEWPYYISDRSESKVLKRLKYRYLADYFGALLTLIVSGIIIYALVVQQYI
jgi:hypothetical protein